MKDHDRWLLAQRRLEGKLTGRRSSSKLPALVEFVRARPIASARSPGGAAIGPGGSCELFLGPRSLGAPPPNKICQPLRGFESLDRYSHSPPPEIAEFPLRLQGASVRPGVI